MSLAFDENGRPFIILREQEKKKRTKGLEAHKVRPSYTNPLPDQHYGSSHCGQLAEDVPGTQRHGQDARQVSAFLSYIFSPDGEVIVTNDGATILEKMEVSSVFCSTSLDPPPNCQTFG